MNRTHNKQKFFRRRSPFLLVVLSVCCLWLGGSMAEGALPAPPQVPDYQDSGNAPSSAPAERQAAPAPQPVADSQKPEEAKTGQATTPSSASTGQQLLPPSSPSSPAAVPANTANTQGISSVPASGNVAAPPQIPDLQKQEAAGSRQSTPPPAATTGQQAISASATDQDIPSMVANFFSNPTSADEAMKLFRTADSRPNKTDKDYGSLHRLLWYALQLGSADATLAYGRLFDPLEPQWWTVKKDAERALAFYQSVALQNQEAQAAMKRLRDSINSATPKR